MTPKVYFQIVDPHGWTIHPYCAAWGIHPEKDSPLEYGNYTTGGCALTIDYYSREYNRLKMATFLLTFSDDGIFGPACWVVAVHSRCPPLSLYTVIKS
jgi:hypothetical protein